MRLLDRESSVILRRPAFQCMRAGTGASPGAARGCCARGTVQLDGCDISLLPKRAAQTVQHAALDGVVQRLRIDHEPAVVRACHLRNTRPLWPAPEPKKIQALIESLFSAGEEKNLPNYMACWATMR